MKAMVMVAHPDDCLIFAYSYMYHHPEYSWTVCYLTYTESDPRGQEFVKFWNRRGITTQFLGFIDDWHDIENKKISFDEVVAETAISKVIQDQDLVLTHNKDGDYGHIHHVFVGNIVPKYHSNIITFAAKNQGNLKLTLDPRPYNCLEEFPGYTNGYPLFGFHIQEHCNEYTI